MQQRVELANAMTAGTLRRYANCLAGMNWRSSNNILAQPFTGTHCTRSRETRVSTY